MRILVTGAGGNLGGAIAARLGAREADQLVATTRRTPAPAGGMVLDLADPTAIGAVLAQARPQIVIHAAGRATGEGSNLFADNAKATANLAAALGQIAPGAGLILLSSAAVYGAAEPGRRWREDDAAALPLDLYGLAKLAAETCAFAEARRSGFRVTALRLFNVVSPRPRGEQMFGQFLRRACAAASAGPPPWRVAMGPLSAVRDFVALDDVLSAVERVIDRGVWGEVVNICTGTGRPAREVIEAVAQALDGRLLVDEGSDERGGVAWSVGDPTGCEARLGFRPSSDLSPLVRAAATAIEGEAARARSGA